MEMTKCGGERLMTCVLAWVCLEPCGIHSVKNSLSLLLYNLYFSMLY